MANRFFIPGVDDDEVEEHLAKLAEFAGRPIPAPDERVRLIEWVHDGVRWTGEVGEQMVGYKQRVGYSTPEAALAILPAGIVMGDEEKQIAWMERVTDPATVLAIFPVEPWIVVTDKAPLGSAPSKWENPFMAGLPTRIGFFPTPGE